MGRRDDIEARANTLMFDARRRIPSPSLPGDCMTHTELADAVNIAMRRLYPDRAEIARFDVNQGWISAMERGDCRWTTDIRRAALRHVLNVVTDADIGLYPQELPLDRDLLRSKADGSADAAKPEPNVRFRKARVRLFGTREALAEAVNTRLPPAYILTANDVGKIERGVVGYPREVRRAAFREALQAESDEALGFVDRRILAADGPVTPELNHSTDGPKPGRIAGAGQPAYRVTAALNVSEADEGIAAIVHSTDFESEDYVDVLQRVDRLGRSVSPSTLNALGSSLNFFVTQYETLDHASLWRQLQKQRRWTGALLDEYRRPAHQRQLFGLGSATAGLLGYVAVGRGDFPLARAYCLEAFTMAEYAEDPNLQAWVRGVQSFCEYYAKDYPEALRFATDGLAFAGTGPQSIRLAINGVARAAGKLGDIGGVHRAVESAHDLMTRNDVPKGVPSSIAFDCYSAAQVASNAATAYVSLGQPDRVQQFIDLAMPDIKKSNSPWSQSLVTIDLASALICSTDPDLDRAADLIIDALNISQDRPLVSVRQRAGDFLERAAQRWGRNRQIDAIREAVTSANMRA
ncbi:hypothetical protein COUCH_14660 [Couchioplanes caeruleus]|uniref:hypothetical protein n=1 Tax=Couchioplanes caeruleus TaxID=56438 RepID=UPI0020C0663B|nr:hypothetical protein [Couchioplanes caeruleus]UQU67431.1 hypothetical protein COUCH_14660 [Couchioplanes caeruleus]